MIIIASFFLILLLLAAASFFIIPLCIFLTELYDDITRSLRWGNPFPFGATFGSALGVAFTFFLSAFAVLGISSDLYFLWNPEKRPKEPEKTREIRIQVPEKVQVHTEFRLNDTVIGKSSF